MLFFPPSMQEIDSRYHTPYVRFCESIHECFVLSFYQYHGTYWPLYVARSFLKMVFLIIGIEVCRHEYCDRSTRELIYTIRSTIGYFYDARATTRTYVIDYQLISDGCNEHLTLARVQKIVINVPAYLLMSSIEFADRKNGILNHNEYRSITTITEKFCFKNLHRGEMRDACCLR